MLTTALAYLRRQYIYVLRRCHLLNSLAMLAVVPLGISTSAASASSIRTDGRTVTQVSSTGSVTDITTSTVRGATAFNSFSRFDVDAGRTVNLHLPSGTENLINLVHDYRTNIDGTLNGLRDGQIAGRVYIFNPNGILIGSEGVVNVGSLTLATPTRMYMDSVIDAEGRVSDLAVQKALSGHVPISASGLIQVRGTINAADEVVITAGEVKIDAPGRIRAGAQVRADFGDLVNVEGLESAAGVQIQDGVVRIVAESDLRLAGRVEADGADGRAAGRVDIEAGQDIHVASSTRVSASGRGQDSDGGVVKILAHRDLDAEGGARIATTGGETGDAGSIEFSGLRRVDLEGSPFDVRAPGGQFGSVLIDPTEFIWTGSDHDVFHTGNYTLEASERIVLDNVMISTRQVAGPDTRDNHLNADSTGDSGNITLRAPEIQLTNGSMLLAHATGSHQAGSVTLEAKANAPLPIFGSFFNAQTFITVANSTIRAGDINIHSRADDTFEWTGEGPVDVVLKYLNNLALFIEASFSVAQSDVWIGANSDLTSSGNIAIASESNADVTMKVLSTVFGFGFGDATSTANATISQATVNATGDVSLRAQGDVKLDVGVSTQNNSLASALTAGASKYVDVAIAYGTAELNAHALVGQLADVTAGGNVNVEAIGGKRSAVDADGGGHLDGTAAAGIAFSFFDSNVTAIVDGKVNAVDVDVKAQLTSTLSTLAATSGVGAGKVGYFIKTIDPRETLINKVTSFVQSSDTASVNSKAQPGQQFGLSASFGYMSHENNVTAAIGEHAQVTATGDVKVNSHIRDVMSYRAAAATDAFRMNIAQETGEPKKVALTASVAVARLENESQAYIDGRVNADGSIHVLANSEVPIPATEWGRWDSDELEEWTDYVQRIKLLLDSGTYSLITGWTQSFAESEKFTLSGSFNILKVDNRADAWLGANARINPGAGPAAAAQDVTVQATAHQGIINLSGVFGFNPKNLFTGAQAGEAGVGGAYLDLTFEGGARAWVEDGAQLRGDELHVTAHTDHNIIAVGESGTKAGRVAINGVFSWVKGDSDTLAQVSPGADVLGRVLAVDALDDTTVVNVAGGFTTSSNVGIGASVAVSEIERSTRALIANREGQTGAGGSIHLPGNLLVRSRTEGFVGGFSLAAAVPAVGSGNQTSGEKDAGDGNKAGFGLSADITYNSVNNLTEAMIFGNMSITTQGNAPVITQAVGSDTNVTTNPGVHVRATDESQLYALAGAIVIQTGQNSIGLAGAYSHNILEKETRAKVGAATLDIENGGSLFINARNEGQLLSISAGGAGAGKVGVAGSAGYSNIENTTEALLQSATVTLENGQVEVEARDESDIRAIAGAATYGGKAGIGAGFSMNEVENTTRASIDGGSVKGSSSVAVDARNDNYLLSVSAALAGSQTAAISGSLAYNVIENTTEALLLNATVDSDGLVRADARDESEILSVTGGIAVSSGQAAVGVTGAYNNIANTTTARAASGTYSGQDVRIIAREEADILAISVGGAGAAKVGVTGSLAINTIGNTTLAQTLSDTNLDATRDIVVEARDESKIQAITGAAAGAGTVAVGASGSYNFISGTVRADVSGSTLDAGRSIDVHARREAELFVIAAGGGGAGTAGFAGSIAINRIGGEIEALVGGGAELTAQNNIHVHARSDSEIDSISGSLAIGGTVGIGGAVTVNDVDVATLARVSGNNTVLTAHGKTGTMQVDSGRLSGGSGDLADRRITEAMRGVAVTASATDDLFATSANVSGGGKVGVAAIVDVSMLGGSTRAIVNDGAKIVTDLGEAHAQQQVRVGGFHHGRMSHGVGGLAAGGAAGVGGGADVNLVSHDTLAEVKNAQVEARSKLLIDARSTTEVESVVTGAGLAGAAGISGSISVANIEGSTLARADGATLTSQDQLLINAESDIDSTVIVGSLGIGGGVGIGASVGVVMLDHETGAYTLGSSVLNARGLTGINAESSHDLTAYGATISGAGGFSLAGTVLVTVMEGQTYAQIGGLTQVNQNLSFANSGQEVSVTAKDTTEISSKLGGLAVDIFGVAVGATVDVSLVRNGVSAGIAGGAQVRSQGDILVDAQSFRDVESLTIAGGGGLTVGISGAVSVANIGSRPGDDADSQVGTSVMHADQLAGGDSFADNLDTDADGATGVRDRARNRQSQVGLASAYEASPSADGYSARAFIGDGATVHTDGQLQVNAKNQTDVDLTAGAAAIGGAVGLGGGAAIADVSDRTLASIGGNITANHLIVRAQDTQDDWSHIRAYAGGGGIVGLGAAVAVFDKSSTAEAKVEDGADVKITHSALIDADLNHAMRADTVQLSVGLAAVGASFSYSDATGQALATIGRDAELRARNISIGSYSVVTHDMTAIGATGGILAGTGTDAKARDRTQTITSVEQDALLIAQETLSLNSQVNPVAYSKAQGAAVSVGASVGVSIARVDSRPTTRTETGSGVYLEGEIISLNAGLVERGATVNARSDAFAAVGGLLLGVGATEAKTDFRPTTEVVTGTNNHIVAHTDLTLLTETRASGDAKANGKNFGLLAGGGNLAETLIDNVSRARLGSGSTVEAGDTVSILVDSRSNLFSETSSGSGGLGAVIVAKAKTDSRATSTAEVRNGPGTTVEAAHVIVDSGHQTTFNTRSDSFAASVAGYSGGRAENLTNLNTFARIGDQARIVAERIDLKAFTDTLKPLLPGGAFNLKSGSGGALDVAAGRSTTNLRHTTRASVGDSAELIASRPDDDQGEIYISARNNIMARDSVKLDSGGAIAIARTESKIETTRGEAEIIIGQGASLESDGDIRMGVQTIADIKTDASSKTYGAAGAAQGNTLSLARADQLIRIHGGATVLAEESVYLNAGTGAFANNLSADAETQLWNKTAFPIETKPDAHGQVNQQNTIRVDTGAEVLAVRDVNALAGNGTVNVRGYGKGTDLYREVVEDVANFFGDIVGADPVSLDIRAGTTSNSSLSTVQVDGTLNAGIRHHQYIVIPKTGPVTEISDSVTYQNVDGVELTSLIQDRIDELKLLADEYDDYSVAREAFLLEIQVLERKLEELGGVQVFVDFVVVEDITARTGNVRLGGQVVGGTGHLIAPGDARIDVTNHSERFLETLRFFIPDDEGGQILMNGIRVGSNSAINNRNLLGGLLQQAQFQTLLDNDSSPPPQITITNTYDPDTPGNNPNLRAPEVFISDDIINLRGNVTISSIGSVNTGADIIGQTIDIFTFGDLIQSFTWGFDHLGGDPVSQLEGIPGQSVLFANITGQGRVVHNLPTQTGSRIIGNNVFISAERVNINGLIQSGIPDRAVVIDSQLVKDIPQHRADYLADVASGVADPRVFWQLNDPGIDDPGIRVVYNAAEDRLELNGVRVQGGHMEIFGDIFSTGNGTLNVMDGYGKINVQNQTTYDLVINRLDTGTGVAGVIRLTDTSQIGADGRFLVTEITRNQNTVFVRNSMTVDAEGNPTFVVSQKDGRSSVFAPHANRRFNWISGRNTIITETKRWEEILPFGISLNWTVKEPTEVSTSSNFIDRVTGDFLSHSSDTVPYRHEYTRFDTGFYLIDWSEDRECVLKIVVCVDERVKLMRKYERRINEFYHHSLYASNDVAVNFIGHDQGEVTIDSQGRIHIAGLVRNLSGPTTIDAREGIQQGGEFGLVIADQLTLSANQGAIGAAGNPLLIEVGNDGMIDATARHGIHLRDIGGDLPIYRIDSGEGDVSLDVDRNIRQVGDQPVAVRSRNLSLVSRNGAIGAIQQPLTVRIDGPNTILEARAADDIGIEQTSGDLRVHTVESVSGDVLLHAPGGSILDFNPNQVADTRTEQELLDLWTRARLIGDAALEGAQETKDAFEDLRTAEYFQYWNMRGIRAVVNGDGEVTGYTAQDYDPNFVFSIPDATAAELLAVNEWNQDDLDRYRDQRTQAYHDAHAKFGGLGAFDPDFRYTITSTEADTITEGAVWTEEQLRSAVSAALFKDVTRTRTVIEDPNVIGREITLIAGNQVGAVAGDIIIPRGVPASTWTTEQQLALAAAERADVTLTDDEIIINLKDDFNIDASDLVRVTSAGMVLLGSESDLIVNGIEANGALRLKTEGSIVAGPTSLPAHIVAHSSILEASSGAIGDQMNPITLALAPGGTLTARSGDGIHISELFSDMLVDSVYSRGMVHLVSPGSILDANTDALINILSDGLHLSASGTIGAGRSAVDSLNVSVQPGHTVSATAGGGIHLESPNMMFNAGDMSGDGIYLLSSRSGMNVSGSLDSLRDIELSAFGQIAITESSLLRADEMITVLAGGSGSGRLLLRDDATIIGSAYGVLLSAAGDIQLQDRAVVDSVATIRMTPGTAGTGLLSIGGQSRVLSTAGNVELAARTDLVVGGQSEVWAFGNLEMVSGLSGIGHMTISSHPTLTAQTGLILAWSAEGISLAGAPTLSSATETYLRSGTGGSGDLQITGQGSITAGRNLYLAADGSTSGNLLIDGSVELAALNGVVDLLATENIDILGPVTVTSSGSLQVQAGAGGTGSIVMSDPATLDAGSSQVFILAAEHVQLGQVRTMSDDPEAVVVLAEQGRMRGGTASQTNIHAPLGGVQLISGLTTGDTGLLWVHAKHIKSLVVTGSPPGLVPTGNGTLPSMPSVLGTSQYQTIMLSTGGELYAGVINANIINTSNPNPLNLVVADGNGGQSEWVSLNVMSGAPVVFDELSARAGRVVSDTSLLSITDGATGLFTEASNQFHSVRVDSSDRNPKPGFDVHMFTLTGQYSLTIGQERVNSDAFLVRYDPRILINGVFSNDNSVELVVGKSLGSIRGERNGDGLIQFFVPVVGVDELIDDTQEDAAPPVNIGDVLPDPDSVEIIEP
ncbi:MAG: leukotoxin LktA family filamentous adhesin [Phycisphaeraceae bacterium]|nr:leukotoxin LktA family filamentous adhesin [Phycisphaeraceae bacterium]